MCPPEVPIDRTTTQSEPPLITPECIPKDQVSQAAYQHAASLLNPDILAHSIRVFVYANQLSEQESSHWHETNRLPLLFVACIFHDIGTTNVYDTGPVRFEIEGADAAVEFLRQAGVSDSDANEVWMAIALHDTPQVAERIPGLVRLVRLAVMADFKRPAGLALFDAAMIEQTEKEFGRGEIEKVLGDAVVEKALKTPEKAPPACWPGELLRAKLENPEWTGINKGF